MAEIVNLNRARKDKVKADKATAAAENRRKFGRTKAERDREATEKILNERLLDGHEREK